MNAITKTILLIVASNFLFNNLNIASAQEKPTRNDITLNPLPSSTRISSDDFILKEITHFEDISFIQYFGVGDIDLDGNPELYISGWTFEEPSPDSPTKSPFYVFEANPDQTEQLSTQALFGRTDTDGTTFLRVNDYNLDGLPDVLIAGHNESPFTYTENILYTNNGSSFDAHPFDYKMAMHEGNTGDFNNDGYPDFIGSAYKADIDVSNDPDFLQGDSGKSGVILYLNDTKGGFSPYILKFNRAVEGDHAADIKWINPGSAAVFGNIDDDPEMEIIIVDSFYNQYGGSTSLIIDNIQFESKHIYGDVIELPDTYFRTRDQFAKNPTKFPERLTHSIQVDLMDVDNDGDNDILINTMIWVDDGHNAAGVIQVLRNDGGQQFTDVTDDALFNYNLSNSASHDMRMIDINNDGFLDLMGVEAAYMEGVDHTWGGENPWQGTLYQAIDKTWANEILINTGNGKFVSTFWDGFHELTLQQEAIYQSYSDSPYNLGDRSYFPYILADGRLGFITSGEMYLNNQNTEFYFDVRAKQKFYTGPKGENSALSGAPGFSEYYYLTENPDVVAMLNAGDYTDGLAHYLAKGKSEGRESFAKNAKVHGSASNDIIVLREGDEKAFGYAGDDSFDGKLGNDILDGGDGTDTALYVGQLNQYTLSKADNGFQLVNRDSSINHQLINIEKLQFGANEYQFAQAENDSDGDGISNTYETANDLNSNDSTDANTDLDDDGINNLTESLMGTLANNKDTDNDGVDDGADEYPLDASKASDIDTDGDGIDDAIDTDDDNDGVLDVEDAFPLDATESVDTDSDGIGNNADTDDDNDGVLDAGDAFPLDATESVDTDGDGIGNNADTDDDGDGVADSSDAYPLDASKSAAPVVETKAQSSGGGGSFGLWGLIILASLLIKKRMNYEI